MFQIKVENLTKSYQNQKIFGGMSIVFDAPQIYGISGYNGSGKSTLLKILAGYVTPTEGSILFFKNQQEVKIEEVYSYLSYAAPYIEPIADGTVKEAIDFHFNTKKRFNGISNQEILDELEILPTVQIKDLSSGMLQRLKLALAMYSESDIVLIDEPTETLDNKWQLWFYEKIAKINLNKLIFVSSNKEADFAYCSQIINILDYK